MYPSTKGSNNHTFSALMTLAVMLISAFIFNPAAGLALFIPVAFYIVLQKYRSLPIRKSGSGVLPTSMTPAIWGIMFLAVGILVVGLIFAVINIGYKTVSKGQDSPLYSIPGLGDIGKAIEIALGQRPQAASSAGTVVTTGPGGQVTTQTIIPQTSAKTATIRWTVSDWADGTAVTTGNEVINVVKNDNYLKAFESATPNVAAATSAEVYSTGDKLQMFVSSDADGTGGTDYYMQSYTISSLDVGARIINDITSEVVGTVRFTTDQTTTYWEFGKLPIYNRASATNTDLSLSLTSTLVSLTNGTGFVTSFLTLSRTQQGTLATNSDNMYLTITLGARGISHGVKFYTLTSDSTPKLEKRVSALWISFVNVDVRVEGEGFSKASAPSTTAVTYVKELDPIIGTATAVGQRSVTIPLRTDALGANTQVDVYVHGPSDGQLMSNALNAVGTTSITGYGALAASNSISLDAIIYARPISYSSGTPATPVLITRIQTPA